MADFISPLLNALNFCLTLLGIALYIGSLLWVLSDAEERTNAGCAIALLVTFTWPVGLLVWWVFRPPKKPTVE